MLDGMHEGVMILSKRSQELIFYNKPAQKLLSSCIEDDASKTQKEKKKVDEGETRADFSNLTSQQVLTQDRFSPVKVSDRNLAGFYKTLLNHSKAKPMSLEQIILMQ